MTKRNRSQSATAFFQSVPKANSRGTAFLYSASDRGDAAFFQSVQRGKNTIAPGEVTGPISVFTDGCAEPNPGRAGWSFVAYRDGVEVAHDFGGFEHATNNIAELTGLLRAVEWISENAPGEPATMISDSKYCVDGANIWRHSWKAKGWKRKGPDAKARNQTIAHLELWQAIDAALTSNPLIQIRWCKGHAGTPGNVRADELASIGRASAAREHDPLTAEYRSIMGEPAWS